MTLSGIPGRTFTGQLDYIYPYAESRTRSVKVRLTFDNSELLLKPEMFAEVVIKSDEQVEVDPNALLRYDIPMSKVRRAIERSNIDVGGRLIEMAETEYMVRGLGYIQSLGDLNGIPVSVDKDGTPIRPQDVAHVHLGPELRRGIVDLNGEGEVAGGVVIMRFGENALATIRGVREKLKELEAGLPEGVEIVSAYDRGDLIERAVDSLNVSLLQELAIVRVSRVLSWQRSVWSAGIHRHSKLLMFMSSRAGV